MPLKDWFLRKSPLQLALERGMKPGGDLSHELRSLGDYTVCAPADGTVVCDLLERLIRADSTIEDHCGQLADEISL